MDSRLGLRFQRAIPMRCAKRHAGGNARQDVEVRHFAAAKRATHRRVTGDVINASSRDGGAPF